MMGLEEGKGLGKNKKGELNQLSLYVYHLTLFLYSLGPNLSYIYRSEEASGSLC